MNSSKYPPLSFDFIIDDKDDETETQEIAQSEKIAFCVRNHTCYESCVFIKNGNYLELYQGTNCGIYWATQCGKCGYGENCRCGKEHKKFIVNFDARKDRMLVQCIEDILDEGYIFMGTNLDPADFGECNQEGKRYCTCALEEDKKISL